ncbi:MAG: DUF115 domain-containing protein [Deltaproteobacteria bacterium]|nr:DUF115 domain-containing protein [Deltaproteobacteria bacterium]
MERYPFLRSNLEVLEKQNPSICRWLNSLGPGVTGPSENLVQNARGFLDWRLPTGKSLFHAMPPWAAYRDWRIPDQAETSVTILVGCNLGYGLNFLLPKLPCSHQVLVLEPRPDMLIACLGHTDYRPFLDTGRLLFLPPHPGQLRETVSRLILPCLFGKVVMRSDLPSLQLGPEYAIWAEHSREALEDLRVRLYTLRLNQDRMIRNELQNYARASRRGSLMTLKGKAAGLTAVVLGAGPSLAEFAPGLAQSRGDALYAASLQVLPALRRWGLKPDLCMAIDCDRSLMQVYNRFDREWAKEIPLIYSTTVHPEVIERYPGPALPLWTRGGLASLVPEGRELVLDVGGNVGVAMVKFMRWCGAEKIVLVGQDFSWRGEETHARGHFSSERPFRFDPRSHTEMKNRQGETVFSAPPYLNALREIERDLEGSPGQVFDLYGGGLAIRGSEPVTWAELAGKGLLESKPGALRGFLQTLRGDLLPRNWNLSAQPRARWRAFLDSARRHLQRLFGGCSVDTGQVNSLLQEILDWLQQEPSWRPYLMNEAINVAGLMYATRTYGRGELERCMEIMDRVEGKVREMERFLVHEGHESSMATFFQYSV